MKKPIEYFIPKLLEPQDYTTSSVEFYPNYYNAYICASISQLCYKSSVDAKHMDEDYKNAVYATLEEWGWSPEDARKTIFINSRTIINEDGSSVPGTQGLILFYKNIAFIAFRGSEKKLNDWLANFNTRKEKSPYVPGNVHRGFLKAFDAIVPDENGKTKKADCEEKQAAFKKILDAFKQNIEQLKSVDAIWLTGHSLGGAIASIGASYLLKDKIPDSRIYIYTFGAPRVGDAGYCEYMNKMLTYRYWRFLHNHDIVPDVPFPAVIKGVTGVPFIGFSRDGCMLRLKKEQKEILKLIRHDGTQETYKYYNGITARHHSIIDYRDRLLNLARQEENPDLPKMEFKMPNYTSLGTTNAEMNIIDLQIYLSKLHQRLRSLINRK